MTGFRQALVDLGAVTGNIRCIAEVCGTENVMAVVKADGYGHGALEVANAALAGGANWLGVADIAEGIALRNGGIRADVLAWLHEPDADFSAGITAGITIGLSSARQLEQVAAASSGRPAAVQIKLETGLSRNGASPAEWSGLFSRARELEIDGRVRVTGLFTHLSNASVDDDREAVRMFEGGVAQARSAGLSPELLHAAATCAAFTVPESRLNLVRIGIGMYGLSPVEGKSSADLGLTPAMTLRAPVAAVRRVQAGTAVSYGYTWRTEKPTTLALVPLGYADGVPRQASNTGAVAIAGRRHPVAGRIAMDQFVVDVGDAEVRVGDEVVVFGDPARGVPSADEWATAAGTINYDIVTRIGQRVERRYLPGDRPVNGA
ncbi:alanine racemase [Okibacterium endophyticum]